MSDFSPTRTPVSLSDILPLTCTRAGTCCHGKLVHLNAWELAQLANARNLDISVFREEFCIMGGVLLAFNGAKGQSACSQYSTTIGCLAHSGRPLACRLFPLGRELKNGKERFIHPGKEFPCLDGCPEVKNLPSLTVSEYLESQQMRSFAEVQDAYLEVLQDFAEWGFVLALETGMERSVQMQILETWKSIQKPGEWLKCLTEQWLDLLTIPSISILENTPLGFVQAHGALLQENARNNFSTLTEPNEILRSSQLAIAISLHLGFGLGADTEHLHKVWVQILQKELQ